MSMEDGAALQPGHRPNADMWDVAPASDVAVPLAHEPVLGGGRCPANHFSASVWSRKTPIEMRSDTKIANIRVDANTTSLLTITTRGPHAGQDVSTTDCGGGVSDAGGRQKRSGSVAGID